MFGSVYQRLYWDYHAPNSRDQNFSKSGFVVLEHVYFSEKQAALGKFFKALLSFLDLNIWGLEYMSYLLLFPFPESWDVPS